MKHRHYWKDWCDGCAWCRCGMTLDEYEKTIPAQRGWRKAILRHFLLYGGVGCKCKWCKELNTLIDRLTALQLD